MSFANPKVFDTFKNALAGEFYTITTKQDGQYVNWAAADKATGDTPSPVKEAGSTGKGSPVVSQYETRDERNARQRLIVRQSSLSNAVSVLGTGAKSPPEPGAVEALAERFTAFVYQAPELYKAPTLAEQPDDIPY